jgi:SAM-dependent methyltransferase
VLELGCGGGRLTGHLSKLSSQVHGIDLSPAMIAYCRDTYPDVRFSEADMRNLQGFAESSSDAVFGPFNVLDVLNDAERRQALEEVRRLLTHGGLLIFSSHNRAYAPLIRKPLQLRTNSLRGLAGSVLYLPRRLRNRRRLLPLQREEADYAILNDTAHDYSMLHYYISRSAQERQLADHGFALLECLDLDGQPVLDDESVSSHPELHYVARRER